MQPTETLKFEFFLPGPAVVSVLRHSLGHFEVCTS